MTLEEAKKLKPGDRVILEGEIISAPPDNDNHITEIGNVLIYVKRKNTKTKFYFQCEPEAIREKIEPTRRKFQEGDIVRYDDELREIEVFNPVPMVGLSDGGVIDWVEADEVQLVCAVENREDRKEEA